MNEPWFRKSKWSWYCSMPDGRQRCLGKHTSDVAPRKGKRGWAPPAEVHAAWLELMRTAGQAAGPADITAGDLFQRFLDGTKEQLEPETREWYMRFLEDFRARHPHLGASRITEETVNAWCYSGHKKPWGPSTRRSAITILKRALNWGVRNKYLAANPVQTMQRPRATVRERILTAEEQAAIMNYFPEGDVFRDFLTALTESGCRPGEAIKVTAQDVDLTEGTWQVKGKMTRVTGKKRTIYMTPALSELTIKLMEEHPEGPLFRNANNEPWTLQAVNLRFRRKKRRKKAPLDPSVVAYVYRGTFATEALAREVPLATVAELLGHVDTTMVSKHYAKLHEKKDHLRAAAAKAVKPEPKPDDTPANPSDLREPEEFR